MRHWNVWTCLFSLLFSKPSSEAVSRHPIQWHLSRSFSIPLFCWLLCLKCDNFAGVCQNGKKSCSLVSLFIWLCQCVVFRYNLNRNQQTSCWLRALQLLLPVQSSCSALWWLFLKRSTFATDFSLLCLTNMRHQQQCPTAAATKDQKVGNKSSF